MRYWDYSTPQLMKFFRASGRMYSTVTDCARFLALWMDRGRLGSSQLLSAESVRKALTRSPLTAQRAGYGLHWSIFTPADSVLADDPEWLPAFGHGGSDGTTAWAMPEDDVIVLYFTQSRGGSAPNEIVRVVLRALGRQ